MRAWSSARFCIPLPPGHRFPIAKYALVRDAAVQSGVLSPREIEEPERVDRWTLGLVHESTYVEAIWRGTLDADASRRLGLPWSAELRERALRTVQGTLEAARDGLDTGTGINLAGGTHHAFTDRGEGFCVFNDVAIAVRTLQKEGRIRRAAIIDLDVHQGNGTATIFQDDTEVYTFSMHGERNYPFHKAASRLDVGLPDGCNDGFYLASLRGHLESVLEESGADLVFYLAGADPYAGDRFGRLRLSIEGLRARDNMVFRACRRRGLPVTVTLAGGYAHRLQDIATIHLNTVRELLVSHG
jgi:acetoin utilization deacetylase AcuC-like enzyme